MFPAVRNEYVNWDDRAFVASEFKGNILSIRNFKEIFAKTVQCEYVPLVKLSFAAENLAAKRNPAVSHAINIAFHSVVSLLVFIFFLSVSGNMVAAFISALLFAVHPLHAEPVAWVSGRKDLLFAIFYLSALVFYLRFKLCRGKVYYYLCLASFILSLLSKSMAVTLPLSMLWWIIFIMKNHFLRYKRKNTVFCSRGVLFGTFCIYAILCGNKAALRIVAKNIFSRICFFVSYYKTYFSC